MSKKIKISDLLKASRSSVEQQFKIKNIGQGGGATETKRLAKKVNKAIKFATKVVNRMKSSGPKTRILVFGEVQSGKTTNYSAIIAKLFDAGSNYIVLTPAVDNVLLGQTFQRMKFQFGSVVNVFHTDDLINSPEKANNVFLSGGKILLVVLKHTKSLDEAIKLTKRWSKEILSPVFIDDEGDQASYNNKKTELSAIHSLINQTLHSHADMQMITVTATPMAHVLVSSDYSIKPDYAFYVAPGDGYFGLEEFVENKDKYVRIVPDIEAAALNDASNNPLPESLKEAILRFAIFIILTFKDEQLQITSMMVNFDQKIKMHQQLSRAVESFVAQDLFEYASINEHLIEKIIADSGIEVEWTSEKIPEIVAGIAKKEIRVKPINSDEDDFEELRNPDVSMIYVGATMMQRGLTFKSLRVSYFTNRAKGKANADTTLQRARWFGYWEEKNLIKVYMQEKVFEDFEAINSAIQDLIYRVNVYERKGLRFNDFEKRILLPKSDLVAVRQTVAPSYRFFLNAINYQNSVINSRAAERFFSTIDQAQDTVSIFPNLSYKGYIFDNINAVYEWMPKEEIQLLLEDILATSEEVVLVLNYLEKTGCGVIFANMYVNAEKDERLRSVSDDGTFFIAQGRNEGTGYLGDRYWWKSVDPDYRSFLAIQLNNLELKNFDSAPIFKGALVIPPDIAAEMVSEYVTSEKSLDETKK